MATACARMAIFKTVCDRRPETHPDHDFSTRAFATGELGGLEGTQTRLGQCLLEILLDCTARRAGPRISEAGTADDVTDGRGVQAFTNAIIASTCIIRCLFDGETGDLVYPELRPGNFEEAAVHAVAVSNGCWPGCARLGSAVPIEVRADSELWIAGTAEFCERRKN